MSNAVFGDVDVCSACTEDPFAPVRATCFGVRDVVSVSSAVTVDVEGEGEQDGWSERTQTTIVDSGAKAAPEPSFACDQCCDHLGACFPSGAPMPCDICGDPSAARRGVSFCYGCLSHVCPACAARTPPQGLPDRHPREAHPR